MDSSSKNKEIRWQAVASKVDGNDDEPKREFISQELKRAGRRRDCCCGIVAIPTIKNNTLPVAAVMHTRAKVVIVKSLIIFYPVN